MCKLIIDKILAFFNNFFLASCCFATKINCAVINTHKMIQQQKKS